MPEEVVPEDVIPEEVIPDDLEEESSFESWVWLQEVAHQGKNTGFEYFWTTFPFAHRFSLGSLFF